MTDVIVPPGAGAHPPVVYETEAAHGHEEHGPSGLLKRGRDAWRRCLRLRPSVSAWVCLVG